MRGKGGREGQRFCLLPFRYPCSHKKKCRELNLENKIYSSVMINNTVVRIYFSFSVSNRWKTTVQGVCVYGVMGFLDFLEKFYFILKFYFLKFYYKLKFYFLKLVVWYKNQICNVK